MLEFIEVESNENIEKLEILAKEIWKECFSDIISDQQINYMLSNFQSIESIKEQINNQGFYYYMFKHREEKVGYMGFAPKKDSLFLSKLYVKESARGKGYARKAFNYICEFCDKFNLNKITLTVNKLNKHAIDVYLKMGFQIINDEIKDIGGGFVMDDYIMEKYLK